MPDTKVETRGESAEDADTCITAPQVVKRKHWKEHKPNCEESSPLVKEIMELPEERRLQITQEAFTAFKEKFANVSVDEAAKQYPFLNDWLS